MDVRKEQITTLLDHGLYDSAQMLGCFLVSSAVSNVETNLYGKAENLVLLGDALFGEKEYKRALNMYKQALQHCKIIPKQNMANSRSSLSTSNRSSSPNSLNISAINENEVKFKISLCHYELSDIKNALAEVEGIPSKARTLRINLTIGKLYRISKHNRAAIASYKECLRQCPYVLEAIISLAELGVSSKDIISLFPQTPTRGGRPPFDHFDTGRWLQRYVEAQCSLASNDYKGKLLMAKYPSLFWTPCAAHCIDLILHDIGKLSIVKKTLKKAITLNGYIYNHPFVLNMMRSFTKQRELIRPAVTRFATAYLTLQSIHNQKHSLRAMFCSEEWLNSRYHRDTGGRVAYETVMQTSFWTNILYVLKVTTPIVRVLRLVDLEKKPAMGYIYEAMDRAKEAIKRSFNDNEAKYGEIWNIIDLRWNAQLHHPLHAAGYYLNPEFYYTTEMIENIEELNYGLVTTIEKLVPDVRLQDRIHQEFNIFREALGLMGSSTAIRHRTTLSPGGLELFSELLQRFPNNVHLLLESAKVESIIGKSDEAILHFEKVRCIDPFVITYMDEYAMLLKTKSDQSKLNRLVGDLLDIDPTRAEVFVVLSVLWERKDERRALAYAEKSIRIDDRHITGHIMKGNLCLSLNRPDAAVVAFRSAQELRPDIRSYQGLVRSYLALSKPKEALLAAREAIRAMPQSAKALKLVGDVHASNSLHREKARKFYESALRLDPGYLGAALALAELHVVEGRNGDAVGLLERYLLDWSDDSLHIKLAQVYSATNMLSDSLSHYQAALRINPHNEAAKKGLVRLEKQMKGLDPDAPEDDEDNEVEDAEGDEEEADLLQN